MLRPRLLALAAVALALSGVGTGVASAYAPAATATIHPGVMTFTDGAQCTANFVFKDAAGALYLGQAAHCSGTGAATDTDGCAASSLPLGTVVADRAGKPLGTMAYNSWLTMASVGETDANTCAYNDLALIKLAPADYDDVNPSVPYWGGPTGVGGSSALGETVRSYGNSSLRAGVTALSPKTGLSLGQSGNGWNHTVYTATPGIPGDSGSAFLDASGRALGVLSTVAILPLTASNGVGDLSRELAYANAHANLGRLSLVNGTEPFSAALLPVPVGVRGLRLTR